jgi:hypothetical protein
MRFEVWAEIHLVAHHFGRIVGVFLAALITTNGQGEVDGWRRRKRVGLSERNLVSAEKILLAVETVVFADDNPAIGFVFTPGIPGSHDFFSPSTLSAEKWRMLGRRQQLFGTICLLPQ